MTEVWKLAAITLTFHALATGTAPARAEEEVDPRIAVEAPAIALVGVRVIDGTGRAPLENQTLVIEGGRIQAIGPAGEVTVPADAARLDLAGRTVLPGLVMLHEHINYFSGRAVWHPQPLSFPPLYLAAGVTTIRTAGTESPTVDRNLKLRIEAGGAVGPRIHLTGPMFNGPAGGFLGDLVLETPEQARQSVDYWADRGFTSFKVYSDIAAEVLAAVIEAAHARGLTVAGHLGSVSCRDAAGLGIDTIEHSFHSCRADLGENPLHEGVETLLASPAFLGLVEKLVESGAVMVATPMMWSARLSDEELDMLHPQAREIFLRDAIAPPPWWPDHASQREYLALDRAYADAGGRLGIGSDPGNTGQIAGYSALRVLENLVEAGWPPLEVIRLATSNNAQILGVAETVGTLAVGLAADLIVVPGDPSQEIGAIRKAELVFKEGVGYDPAELRASVRGKVGWH